MARADWRQEECDDWEEIVDAAIVAGNVGNKGLNMQELKEALLPPCNHAHRYV
jgi:hypothetical protein